MDCRTTHGVVEDVLSDCKQARDSDDVLYAEVVKRLNPAAGRLTFNEVILNRKFYGIPNFETVRRTRQKIQAKNSSLRGSEEATDARYQEWKKVREYVLEED